MTQDGMYYKVTQEYLHYNALKRTLMQKRDKIDARLEVIEEVLVDLNDILCKHGNHIYEHFVETDPQAKTGHWIDSSNGWMCSECNKDNTFDTNYCPNCGARMVEPQKSEGRECI